MYFEKFIKNLEYKRKCNFPESFFPVLKILQQKYNFQKATLRILKRQYWIYYITVNKGKILRMITKVLLLIYPYFW